MRVSREFKSHFDLVSKYYGLEGAELEAAKDAVRRDPEGSRTCYAAMGQWIRQQAVVPKVGTILPTITRDQIDAQIAQLDQARKRGIVRDVRSGGRDDSLGTLKPGGARKRGVNQGS